MSKQIPWKRNHVRCRTFECSIRVLIGQLLMFESEKIEVSRTNLERIQYLQAMGVGPVVRPNEVRLAEQAANIPADGDTLSTHIEELQRQLADNERQNEAVDPAGGGARRCCKAHWFIWPF